MKCIKPFRNTKTANKFPSPRGDEVHPMVNVDANGADPFPSPRGDEVHPPTHVMMEVDISSFRPLAGMKCIDDEVLENPRTLGFRPLPGMKSICHF